MLQEASLKAATTLGDAVVDKNLCPYLFIVTDVSTNWLLIVGKVTQNIFRVE
jgi:hypothetical protein